MITFQLLVDSRHEIIGEPTPTPSSIDSFKTVAASTSKEKPCVDRSKVTQESLTDNRHRNLKLTKSRVPRRFAIDTLGESETGSEYRANKSESGDAGAIPQFPPEYFARRAASTISVQNYLKREINFSFGFNLQKMRLRRTSTLTRTRR